MHFNFPIIIILSILLSFHSFQSPFYNYEYLSTFNISFSFYISILLTPFNLSFPFSFVPFSIIPFPLLSLFHLFLCSLSLVFTLRLLYSLSQLPFVSLYLSLSLRFHSDFFTLFPNSLPFFCFSSPV